MIDDLVILVIIDWLLQRKAEDPAFHTRSEGDGLTAWWLFWQRIPSLSGGQCECLLKNACFIKTNTFPQNLLPPSLCMILFCLYSRIHFPVLLARDPWHKGRREVCGWRGASLRHAKIQRGSWFTAHLTGNAHQHAGWVRLHKLKLKMVPR